VKAERAFRQSLAAKSHPFTWVFLSETLLRQGRDKESKNCLRRALLLNHDYEEAHYNLGCAYKLSGQYALAERHLKRAIEIDPKYSLAYAELGHVWLLRKKGAKEAISFLRKSISYDPEYGWTRVYLANALWRLRKLKAADEQFRKVIEIWPNDSLSYWCYGDFLAYEGSDRSVAEKHLRKAIEMEPSCKLTNYYLGKHLHYWGRKEEGLKLLRRAAQLGHPSAQKRLQAINQGRI
jgi:tetratricopeptide (TPR) repeat protein